MAQAHVMVDLETFGTGNDAAIVSIGAVKFIPEHHFVGERFYVVVEPGSAVAYGGVMDASTVLWWMGKERTEAREAMLAENRVDLPSALEGFAMWYGQDPLVPVWGNGATFDNIILRSAFKRAGIDCPWGYKADRCYRTINNLKHNATFGNIGVAHNAVDDARAQAAHLMEVARKLGISLT